MVNVIREMKSTDLEFAAECACAAGRSSETVEELESFLLRDPGGCWIAQCGRKPVGFSVARWYGKSGFLGAITLSGISGEKAVERQLLDRAVKYLTVMGSETMFAEIEPRSAGVFERVGFVKLCRILSFTGNVYGRSHNHVRELRRQDLSFIVGLDRISFRANRLYFLGRRYTLTPRYCKVLEMKGRIVGYIMARRGNGVMPVGPWVVSASVDCPVDLLEALAVEARDEKLLIEVLETNSGVVELLRTLGMVESPEPTWRMLLGGRSKVGTSDTLCALGSPFAG